MKTPLESLAAGESLNALHSLPLGAHMSTAGGLERAVERARAAGCRVLQVFTKNSNQWAGKPVSAGEAARFQQASREAAITPVASHAAYLINLASINPEIRERSVLALVDELERCAVTGIPFLVLHPGSHGGDGEETGISRIAGGLDSALSRAPSGVTVLLETAAGQGHSVGSTFESLARIREAATERDRIAYCLDTCHVHAAGYDIVSPEGFQRTLGEAEQHLGLSLIKVIHVNDSKKERGCRVDRHERIGLGCLGEQAFRNLMTEPALVKIPKILETPKDDDGEYDKAGLAVLRRLALPLEKAPATVSAAVDREPSNGEARPKRRSSKASRPSRP